MKKVILVLAVILGVSQVFSSVNFTNADQTKTSKIQTDFCKGWEDGYCEGWKDVKGQFAVCPVEPVCPVPNVGANTYKGGYNKGFKAGRKKAKK